MKFSSYYKKSGFFLLIILLINLTLVNASYLTVQQLDDIRSAVANSGVKIDYLVDDINLAAEEANQQIQDPNYLPKTFFLFTSPQKTQIMGAVQKVVYPPKPAPVIKPTDITYPDLQSLEDQKKIDAFNIILAAHPGYKQSDAQTIYDDWLVNYYEADVCR